MLLGSYLLYLAYDTTQACLVTFASSLSPSPPPQNKELNDFLAEKIKEMGMNQTISLKAGSKFSCRGNRSFSPHAEIVIPSDCSTPVAQYGITRSLVRIQYNDQVTIAFVPIVCAITVTLFVFSFSPIGAIGSGLLAKMTVKIVLLRKLDQRAEEISCTHCDIRVLEAARNKLQTLEKHEPKKWIQNIERLGGLPLRERITILTRQIECLQRYQT